MRGAISVSSNNDVRSSLWRCVEVRGSRGQKEADQGIQKEVKCGGAEGKEVIVGPVKQTSGKKIDI